MISLCILARDVPHIETLIKFFNRNCDAEFEVCIGDNSKDERYSELYKELSDVYIRIEDKELFKMGIPWGHNRIAALANTYKIVYLDSDEYPIWIAPNIEDIFDEYYVPGCLRGDFFSMEEIMLVQELNLNEEGLKIELRSNPIFQGKEWSMQDRIYNSRYVQFNGVCHAIFHVPFHFISKNPHMLIMHNETIRKLGNRQRTGSLIKEQFNRMIINPDLRSSDIVMQWARKETASNPGKHDFKDWNEFEEFWNKNV